MPTNSDNSTYDVIIAGGGASGTALLYVLSRYTNIRRIALLEKHDALGNVNSHATKNSQTLHVGDIETNYDIEKVRQVKPAAIMVKRYADALPRDEGSPILRKMQKMVLGVGAAEIAELEKRYEEIKELFPELEKLDATSIARVEPEVMRGRSPHEPVLALFNQNGYAINYGLLSRSFAKKAQEEPHKQIEVLTGHTLTKIEKYGGSYILTTEQGNFRSPIVIVDTDAYSLGFAKKLGYGKEFSLIPVAGSFYFTPEKLRGKVYRVQEKRMPFAAVHGDPDLTKEDVTRWGPTARFYPVLEAGDLHTMGAFFASAGLHRPQTWVSFIMILLEPIRFWYLVKNFFYDLPLVGKHFFIPQIRRIIPTIRVSELRWAKGYGGMRLQRVHTTTHELLLGEGKIIGDNIIFNMSPSPGASVCIYNAVRDTEQIMKFAPQFSFDKKRMLSELCEPKPSVENVDVSLRDTYAS